MPRRLSKLRIDEISSVDRGANPGARVLIMKRDAAAGLKPKPKPPPRLNLFEIREAAAAGSWKPKVKKMINVAKALLRGEHIVHHTASDFYAAIEAGGEAIRKRDPKLTPAMAFAKFATEDVDGKVLM